MPFQSKQETMSVAIAHLKLTDSTNRLNHTHLRIERQFLLPFFSSSVVITRNPYVHSNTIHRKTFDITQQTTNNLFPTLSDTLKYDSLKISTVKQYPSSIKSATHISFNPLKGEVNIFSMPMPFRMTIVSINIPSMHLEYVFFLFAHYRLKSQSIFRLAMI